MLKDAHRSKVEFTHEDLPRDNLYGSMLKNHPRDNPFQPMPMGEPRPSLEPISEDALGFSFPQMPKHAPRSSHEPMPKDARGSII